MDDDECRYEKPYSWETRRRGEKQHYKNLRFNDNQGEFHYYDEEPEIGRAHV